MDLKPENLLVERGEIVKITDFGLAHRVRVTNGAYERRYAGSWPYAAPERFADEPCDPRSDIYSLGVILYEMLTGEFPYPFELADDPAEAYMQLRDFHAAGGMSRIISSLYYQGIHGANREIGEVLSIFLSPFRSERSPGFGHALRLMRRLGAKPRTIPVERLTLAEQLARAEGLQMVGRHSQALSIINRIIMEAPGNVAFYLAAVKSLEATGDTRSAKHFRERARSVSLGSGDK